MDGHCVHPGQQVATERFREAVKPNFFITLVSEELFDVLFVLVRFEIVFSHGIDLVFGVRPWPETLA
jgi:hypothetical protein